MHGKPGVFQAIPAYKKTVSKQAMDRFAADFDQVVAALNEVGARTPDDMKNLIKDRHKELGIEVHEAFDGLEVCSCGPPVLAWHTSFEERYRTRHLRMHQAICMRPLPR